MYAILYLPPLSLPALEHFHHPLNSPGAPLPTSLPSFPSPRQTISLLSVAIVSRFLEYTWTHAVRTRLCLAASTQSHVSEICP